MNNFYKQILFTNVKNSNKNFSKHFHNTYSLGITHKGLYKSKHQNNTFDFYTYSTRINNPYELHGGSSFSWTNYYFYPSVDYMRELYRGLYFENKAPVFEKHIVEDKILYKKLSRFFSSYYQKEEVFIQESLCIDALSYLIKNYAKKDKCLQDSFNEKKIIKSSIEYINDTLLEKPSLDELALNASLSKYHFLRIFKKELGLTPHNYIINKRVEKARELIQNGTSIAEASLEVGFNDQSHFNRNFKKIFDFSPTLLRKIKPY